MSIPRIIRDYANRRRHVQYGAWPGDIYHIPLYEANYVVGLDGASLAPADPWGHAEENQRRMSLTRMYDT